VAALAGKLKALDTEPDRATGRGLKSEDGSSETYKFGLGLSIGFFASPVFKRMPAIIESLATPARSPSPAL